MVRTHGLAKHFVDAKKGLVKAVDDVTLEASPGQIVGLLGVNGAGKTTLLRMLSTVLTPTSGTAEIAGFDTVKDSEKVRSHIGFMSNSTALYGRLSPLEILDYFAGLYGMSGAVKKQRIDHLVERLGIGEFANRLCDKLSTGQKQRVSIARTILHDPPVLFFDEPTAGLDVVTSQTVMTFIEEARCQGKTVVYCTHIMSEVERLCDHVYVIHDGVLKGSGTVDELKASVEQTSLEKAFLELVGYQAKEVTA